MTGKHDGVECEDVVVGDGPIARPGRYLELRYRMSVESETLDTRDRFAVRLGESPLIRGVELGLEGMRRGGRRRLRIRPDLGYGSRSYRGVPPDSWLEFDIELLQVDAEPVLLTLIGSKSWAAIEAEVARSLRLRLRRTTAARLLGWFEGAVAESEFAVDDLRDVVEHERAALLDFALRWQSSRSALDPPKSAVPSPAKHGLFRGFMVRIAVLHLYAVRRPDKLRAYLQGFGLEAEYENVMRCIGDA